MSAEKTFLERYLAGEHIQVWEELRRLDANEIYKQPMFSDVYGVAQATMRRVKANIETLMQRWQAKGMSFEYEVLEAPEPGIHEDIAAFEQEIGRTPLSIRAFWEIVGSVNFCGEDDIFTKPGTELDYDYSDPSWVYPPSLVLMDARTNFRSEEGVSRDELPESAFRGSFAPDIYVKDNTSGGWGPEFQLTPGVDCDIYEEEHYVMPFVDYLRHSIAWAGFPGFSLYGKPHYHEHFEAGDDLPALLKEVAKDLLPF